MDAQTEHIPNRITSRCLFSKPVSYTDWSLASNESIYSLHKGNVSRSIRHHGLVALELNEFQDSNESIHKTETNSVKESVDDENDAKDDHEVIKLNNEDNQEDMKEIILSYSSEQETNLAPSLLPVKELQDSDSESDDEEKELEDDVKEIIADTINSFSSFSFPILNNEDGSVKTPYFERNWNVSEKKQELYREETLTQTRQPQYQQQFYFIPASHMLTHQLPQRISLSRQVSQTQSEKAYRNRWFSCFFGSAQDD